MTKAAQQVTRALSPNERRCVEARLQQFRDDAATAEEHSFTHIDALHRSWKHRRGAKGPMFSGQDARDAREQVHSTLVRLSGKLADLFVQDVDAGANPTDLVKRPPWCNTDAKFFSNLADAWTDAYADTDQSTAPSQSTVADDYDPRAAADEIITAHRRAREPDRSADNVVRPDLQNWRRRS